MDYEIDDEEESLWEDETDLDESFCHDYCSDYNETPFCCNCCLWIGIIFILYLILT